MSQPFLIEQADRWLTIDTPLGKDVLILTAFEGDEGMSRLFSYRLHMLSRRETIGPEEILGKPVTFNVVRADKSRRPFNGIVKSFGPGASWVRGYRSYHAEVVPWFWLLTRTTDCRIFQTKSVPDIAEAVFGEMGFSDYDISGIKGSHPKHDYRVQYRESDFNFISRLLEEEGIFYFFKHEDGRHTLVLADEKAAYYDLPENRIEYRPSGGLRNHVNRWEPGYAFRSGKWAQRDYNFETPTTDLLTTTNTVLQVPAFNAYEQFDYPGRYPVKGDGEQLTRWRMEEEEAPHAVTSADSDCRTFSAGGKFTFTRHDVRSEEGKTYVITGIQHFATDYSHVPGEGSTSEYRNSFTVIPATVTFRAPRETEKPVVRGPQTAVVVGPGGEEIYCDKYGRIKVQFHWDRLGRKDEQSSCWMRVAQVWAGRNWGTQYIPRIGHEVLVDFLEGDPDRPIVVGSVYNADNMPPYGLPGNKTQSGIKSRSSKQGGEANFNELRFEDKKGAEEVYFHAEKDFTRVVENDDDLEVGNDQTIVITNNRTETVKQGDETVTIKQGNRSVSIDMGNESLRIKMGNQTTRLDLGKSETEAMQSIELKVGQSSVKVDQMGVTIKGMMIKIEGQMMVDVKGMMTTVQGSGMLTLKGGIIMIN